jgi:hypothetical protein
VGEALLRVARRVRAAWAATVYSFITVLFTEAFKAVLVYFFGQNFV